MADQGFANQRPILIPLSGRGRPMRGAMKRDFRSCRSSIERVFGIIKSAYCSVGTRRYRNNCFLSPLLCNLAAALANCCKGMFTLFRRHLNI